MKAKAIKNIDQYIGKPISAILTFYEIIRSIFLFKSKNTQTKKILFFKLTEQGSSVLAYSAVKRAIDIVGRTNVYFCVFEDNREILDIMNIIPKENILPVRQNNIFIFLFDSIKTLIKIRKLKIDTVIDMEFFSRASAIFIYLTGAEKRIGYHRFTSNLPYRGNLMTHRIQYNPYIHIAKSYLLLVESIFLNPKETPMPKIKIDDFKISVPKFEPTEAEVISLKDKIREQIKNDIKSPIVIINPNASDLIPLRRWPICNFIALIKKLIKEFAELTIIITGESSEQNIAGEICNTIDSKRVINLTGKISLRELVTLYTISDVIVTNDSGPGHFASLTDINDVVLFGPETPRLFAPLGKNIHIIHSNFACSPCVNMSNYRFSSCKNNLCMQAIKAEQVYNKVKEILTGQ